MANTDEQPDIQKLSALLQLEDMVRKAESLEALQFLIVNESRRLFPYTQCNCLVNQQANSNFRLTAASSISVIDRDAPMVKWLEALVNHGYERTRLQQTSLLTQDSCPADFQSEWQDYSHPFVMWCPFTTGDGTLEGGLWFARDDQWTEQEIVIATRLAETYAYSILALQGRMGRGRATLFPKGKIYKVLLVALLLIMLLPVRLSTLSPAEVVASNPFIVSAPIDGVIQELPIAPNTRVNKGQVILIYDDTHIRSRYDIAEKSVAVARAAYEQARQAAFMNAESKARLPLLEQQLKLKMAEKDYAEQLLSQVSVKAPKDGLLIYRDKNDWIGQPVQVGQRIMEIADPTETELRIEMAVEDSITLSNSAEVRLFLDMDPLNSWPATVTHASYQAELTANDILAYRVKASFTDTDEPLRIGLKGTAKIFGDNVPLFYYLFRRPISFLRQFTGI